MATTTVGRNAAGLLGRTQITVRIGKGVAVRPVTVPLPADAEITWTTGVGDDTFTATVPWPDRGIARPDAFTPNMPVRVEDRRTGEILWQGRIADPGFTGGRHSTEFRLSCVGSGHDLQHIAVLKNYLDRDLGRWVDLKVWQAGQMVATDDLTGIGPSSVDALGLQPTGAVEYQFPANTIQRSGSYNRAAYLTGLYTAQDMDAADLTARSTGAGAVVPEIYVLRWSWRAGAAGAANTMQALIGSAAAGSTIVLYNASFPNPTAQTDVNGREGAGAWTRTDIKLAYLGWTRTGADVTATVDGWLRFANVEVVGRRYDRYGNLAVSSNAPDALSPYEVVEDMLGTILNGRFDPGVISADPAILIDQASYWEPTMVADILDDAQEWNPDAWWAVWAPADVTSKPRLEYRGWNTTPRYVIDDTSVVELAGGAETWANSALVHFLRGNGVPTTTRATITVPAIGRIFGSSGVGTAAANTRDAIIDLTDRGPMHRSKAVELAGAILADATVDKASGSTTVRAPLMDDLTGKLAQPWEIRPGWPVQVGSTPNQYSSGTTRLVYDGESTFRLTKVAYSASSNTATLSLDGGRRRLYKSAGSSPRFTFKWRRHRRRHHR